MNVLLSSRCDDAVDSRLEALRIAIENPQKDSFVDE
jgi:hypothetical protein